MAPSRRRTFLDDHPGWWLLLLCGAAWTAMLRHTLAPGVSCHQVSRFADGRNFVLMVLAMMLPALAEPVRWVAARSFRSRRSRAIVGYLVGYLLPWLLLAVGAVWLLGHRWAHDPRLAPASFAAAALWSATPIYQALVGASHRTIPLAPLGVPADVDCLRFGLAQGAPCAAACGLLMIGCALTGHGLIAMAGGALLALLERRSFRPRPWLVPIGCLLLAGWYAAT